MFAVVIELLTDLVRAVSTFLPIVPVAFVLE